MSPADRNKQRRLLAFEHLETKISPTASFWDMVLGPSLASRGSHRAAAAVGVHSLPGVRRNDA